MSSLDLDAAIGRQVERSETARKREETSEDRRGYTTEDWQADATYDDLSDARLAGAKQVELSYRPSKPAEISAGIAGKDRRELTITLGRLWIDAGRAVARWRGEVRCPKSHTENLQTDVMHLILRWPSQGGGYRKLPDGTRERTEVIDLGGSLPLRMARGRAMSEPSAGRRVTRWIDSAERILADGTLPRRQDWIVSEDRPAELSPLAWRALHAAVRQAARRPEYLLARAQEQTELMPADASELDQLVEEQERDRAGSVMPDVLAPEILAGMLSIPLDAARAMVAESYPGAPMRELAAQWGIGEQAAKNALTRGRAAIRKRYPSSDDLWIAINRAADQWAIDTARNAATTIKAYRHGMTDRETARNAALWYRAANIALPDSRRALLAACRQAAKRYGGGERWYGSELPEITARQVTLHMRLLGRQASRRGEVGNALAMRRLGEIRASDARMRSRQDEQELFTRRQLQAAFAASESEPNRARQVCRWLARAEQALTVEALTCGERVWTYGLAARDSREILTDGAMAQAEILTDSRREQAQERAYARQEQREQAGRDRAARTQVAWEQERARQAAMRACD